jgi:hypothetical protein
MNQGVLSTELGAFFRSSATNVEILPDSLRVAISVKTKLEDVLERAVASGKHVVVAGTAGSGKTHLIKSANVSSNYRIVLDLTAEKQAEWRSLFSGKEPVIVGGNEGAFLLGAQKKYKGFQEAVDLLHQIQRGEVPQSGGPVVIDVAGFDPVGNHVIADMLGIPLVAEFVRSKGESVRTAAWACMENPKVRERVARLAQLASAETDGDGFTFRQLWQFVAELAERGESENSIWFSQLMSRDTRIGSLLADYFSVSSLPFTHIGNRLWHGDYNYLKDKIVPEAQEILKVLLSTSYLPQDPAARKANFGLIRMFAALCLVDSPLDAFLSKGSGLWASVRALDHRPLLKAINRYMSYDLIELGHDLHLWTLHDTERRDKKPDTQISLGVVAYDKFELRQNVAVANCPKGIPTIYGSRYSLHHPDTKSILHVSKDLVDALEGTRSHRTIDRRHVEYDWRLLRFFSQIASEMQLPVDKLRAAIFDFQKREGRMVSWLVGGNAIEWVAN